MDKEAEWYRPLFHRLPVARAIARWAAGKDHFRLSWKIDVLRRQLQARDPGLRKEEIDKFLRDRLGRKSFKGSPLCAFPLYARKVRFHGKLHEIMRRVIRPGRPKKKAA